MIVEINLDKVFDTLSQKRLEESRYLLMNNMMADMTQYVPLDKSPLRMSVHIDADKEHIVWRTPYAKAQYYGSNGKVTFRNYTTPGTGPLWDKTASANHMDSWELVFKTNMGL